MDIFQYQLLPSKISNRIPNTTYHYAGKIVVWNGKIICCEHNREKRKCKLCIQTEYCSHKRIKKYCPNCFISNDGIHKNKHSILSNPCKVESSSTSSSPIHSPSPTIPDTTSQTSGESPKLISETSEIILPNFQNDMKRLESYQLNFKNTYDSIIQKIKTRHQNFFSHFNIINENDELYETYLLFDTRFEIYKNNFDYDLSLHPEFEF